MLRYGSIVNVILHEGDKGLIGGILVPYGVVEMQLWPNDTAQMTCPALGENLNGVTDCSPNK